MSIKVTKRKHRTTNTLKRKKNVVAKILIYIIFFKLLKFKTLCKNETLTLYITIPLHKNVSLLYKSVADSFFLS